MHNSFFRLLAFTFVVSLYAYGQASDSIIVGTVTDASGAAVPNATVTAQNKSTAVKYPTVTNDTGEYRINNIPIGMYDVTATANGFTAASTSGVELQLNRTTSVNLTLTIGSVSTTVEVTAASAAIDTSTAQLQSTFESNQAEDLPAAGTSKTINGAGIYNLSLVGAGVTSSGGVGQGMGPSVSGQRPDANSFNIDGVANDDHYNPAAQIYISNEAVAQFTLLQNQFGAEFGGASGGIFNIVVKSGSNQIHGALYDYMQNRNLNAVDALYVHQGILSNPRYDDNRLGANIGGPILKDKLFYFGDFEYNPHGAAPPPPNTICAPTQGGLGLLNGMANLSKNNLGIFEKYVPIAPTATSDCNTAATNGAVIPGTLVNGTAIPLGDLSVSGPSYNNAKNAVVSVDYNLSTKDQLRGRYFYSNSTGIDFNAELPVFWVPTPTTGNSGSFSEFHNFSPTTENEVRVSFSRFNNAIGVGDFKFPGLNLFPNLAFDDLGLQLGPDPNAPSGYIENKFQIQENLTKTIGRHTIKAGYNLVDIILTGNFVQRVRGDYDYADLEQYLLDMSPTGGNISGVSGERSAGAGSVPFGFLQHAAYVQDDFRMRPNLTLNLGLRYEYVTVPVGSRYQVDSALANVPGVITFGVPKSNPNEWSPRLGFNYSPGKDSVWSIRGGVARSFFNTYINLNQNSSPAYFATTLDVGSTSTPNFLANGGLTSAVATGPPTVASARSAVSSYTFDQTRPYALTGTLGVQRQFAKDYTLEVRYVYTKGVHLYNQTRLNRTTPITSTFNIPTYLNVPSAATLGALGTTLGQLDAISTNSLAQYGFSNNIVGYHPWGNSRYNGLQTQLNKRYSQNLSMIVAYTWSHAQDDSTATNFSTILSPRRAQDFQDMSAEWSDSALDRRHRLTVTPVYDFKPFQGGNWLMKNVVGNWNISGTYTFQSPEYATIQSGIDSNLNGDTAGDRTVINPKGVWNVGSGVTPYNAAGQVVALNDPSTVAYVANNPNARYILAGYGAYPNGGRNTFPLGRINNFDVALMKRFTFREHYNFEIGTQAFNLLNHSQFIGGNISDVSPFSTSALSRSFLTPTSTQFGQYDQVFSSNSRTMQLVAKFRF